MHEPTAPPAHDELEFRRALAAYRRALKHADAMIDAAPAAAQSPREPERPPQLRD
jgi:hypothetical protein